MPNKNILITGGSLQASSRGIVALVLGTITSIQLTNSDVSFTVIGGRYNASQVTNIEIEIGDGKFVKEYMIRTRQYPFLLLKSILIPFLPQKFRNYILNFDPVVAAFVQADAIVSLSVGDSFSDIYGYRQFFSVYLFDLMAILLRRPLIIFPQTIGPFNKYVGRILARFSLSKAKLVFTRDGFSTETVRKLCGSSVSVLEKVDMAFLMQPEENNTLELTRDRLKIGLNISGFMHYSQNAKKLIGDFDYFQFMKDIIELFVKKYDVDILLVPHDYSLSNHHENDLYACEALYVSLDSFVRERVTILREIYTAPKLKSIIGECDFFVGARLHACIAALSMGVPTVPIAYSYKFLGVLQKMDLNDFVVCDPRKENSDKMIAKIQVSFENRVSLRCQIEEKLPAIREIALSCGKILSDLILTN